MKQSFILKNSESRNQMLLSLRVSREIKAQYTRAARLHYHLPHHPTRSPGSQVSCRASSPHRIARPFCFPQTFPSSNVLSVLWLGMWWEGFCCCFCFFKKRKGKCGVLNTKVFAPRSKLVTMVTTQIFDGQHGSMPHQLTAGCCWSLQAAWRWGGLYNHQRIKEKGRLLWNGTLGDKVMGTQLGRAGCAKSYV